MSLNIKDKGETEMNEKRNGFTPPKPMPPARVPYVFCDSIDALTRGLPVEDVVAIQNAVAARTMRRSSETSGGVELEFTDGDGNAHWIYVSAALADEICPAHATR
jgi:hypothetical protein